MNYWDIVVVIIALIGLFATVVKPVVQLTKSIATLTAALNGVDKKITELTTDNKKSHERIWQHEDKQDEIIGDHEKRIIGLETKK